jgi:hypothetical protein
MKTINDILSKLGPDDGRIPFWEDIKDYIKEKKYTLLLRRMISHNFDYDFNDQVEIMAQTIVCEKAGHTLTLKKKNGEFRIGKQYLCQQGDKFFIGRWETAGGRPGFYFCLSDPILPSDLTAVYEIEL